MSGEVGKYWSNSVVGKQSIHLNLLVAFKASKAIFTSTCLRDSDL